VAAALASDVPPDLLDPSLLDQILNDAIPPDDARLTGRFAKIVEKVGKLGHAGVSMPTQCLDGCERWVHAVISVCVSRGLSEFRRHYQAASPAPFLDGPGLLAVLQEVLGLVQSKCACLDPSPAMCSCPCHSVKPGAARRPARCLPATGGGLTGIEFGVFLPCMFTAVLKGSDRVYMLSSELHRQVSASLGTCHRSKEDLARVGIELMTHGEATELLQACVHVDSGWESLGGSPLKWGVVKTSDFTLDGTPLVQRRVLAVGGRAVWSGIIAEDVFDGHRRYCFKEHSSPRPGKAGLSSLDTDGYFSFLVYLLERRYSRTPPTFSDWRGQSASVRREVVQDCFESGLVVHKRNPMVEVLKKSVIGQTYRQRMNQNAALQLLTSNHALFTGFAFKNLSMPKSVASGLCLAAEAQAEQETGDYLCAIRILVDMVGQRSHEAELRKCKRALVDISSLAGSAADDMDVLDLLARIRNRCEDLDGPVSDNEALNLQKRMCNRVGQLLTLSAP
jgi:hypothetical protein